MLRDTGVGSDSEAKNERPHIFFFSANSSSPYSPHVGSQVYCYWVVAFY